MAGDLGAAIAHYNQLAPEYDQATRRINNIRLAAIAALKLEQGDIVLDAGCGTGYCLAALSSAVGDSGRVVAFEPAPAMLEVARQRVQKNGWNNVRLLESAAENVCLPVTPNAVLFSYTHDLLQSETALRNLFSQCAEGAHVTAVGTKLFASWLTPGNFWIKWRHRQYITDLDALDQPWRKLFLMLEQSSVAAHPLRQHYIASGKLQREYSQVR